MLSLFPLLIMTCRLYDSPHSGERNPTIMGKETPNLGEKNFFIMLNRTLNAHNLL